MSVKTRGFASISDPKVRQALASLGGKAAVKKGVGHRFDSSGGRNAGKKGLVARRKRKHQKSLDKKDTH